MITRIVKMHFKEQNIPLFFEIFSQARNQIASFDGCLGVEIFQDALDQQIIFTFSKWENEAALELYRNSELFKSTWSKAKILFQEKAQAWSLEKKEE